MSQDMFQNFNKILIGTVIFLRAIIALPLAFAAKKHFAFFNEESIYLTYFVSYVSIFAVELIMTLFSFITAKYRAAGLRVGYHTALGSVLFFGILNAILIWNIQYVYENVPWIAQGVLQTINLASVLLPEAIGFMKTEIPSDNLKYREITSNIPEEAYDIKNNPEIPLVEKVKLLWDMDIFSTQTDLARFLVIKQSTVSNYLRK